MTKDHLARRGYKPNPEHIIAKGFRGRTVTTEIVGRRARKMWECSHEQCISGKIIEWDDVYVQVNDPFEFIGPQSVPSARRYHFPCAISLGLLLKESAVDLSTDRRAAVAMSKLKHVE